jgi:hypothetical protein
MVAGFVIVLPRRIPGRFLAMPLLDSLQKLRANPGKPVVYASTRNFKGSAGAGVFLIAFV